jgi:hypothetical protein
VPSGAPPEPGPAVSITGVAFRYVSPAPCGFDPPTAPPALVAVGPGGRPPTKAGSGPCELPTLRWQVGWVLRWQVGWVLRWQLDAAGGERSEYGA